MIRTSQSSFHLVRLCGCSSVMSSVVVVASAVLAVGVSEHTEFTGCGRTTIRFCCGGRYAQKHNTQKLHLVIYLQSFCKQTDLFFVRIICIYYERVRKYITEL